MYLDIPKDESSVYQTMEVYILLSDFYAVDLVMTKRKRMYIRIQEEDRHDIEMFLKHEGIHYLLLTEKPSYHD